MASSYQSDVAVYVNATQAAQSTVYAGVDKKHNVMIF